MSEVIAYINTETSTGRRIIRELEKHKKTVRIEYPLSEDITQKGMHTIEEVFGKLENKLNTHYGTDLELKY